MSQPSAEPVGFSYVRFSHTSQGAGDSLRRQTDASGPADWCKRNRVRLDTSVTLHDLGVSAYTGAHRKNPDRHALAAFLKLIEQGRVPHGSYLLIENLDRLSREDEVPACHLLTGILMAGVRVVQLSPYEMLLTEKSNGWELMRAVMELSRGHNESKVKSERVGKAWDQKRKRAADHKTVMSRSCPAWLEVQGEGESARYVLVPERAEAVRMIFTLARAGRGSRLIVKALNAAGVKPMGRKPWNVSYVKRILANRSAFGEFTPRTGRGHSWQRKPAAPAIAGFYPAVITEEEFDAAQKATRDRRGKGGRTGRQIINLFATLAHDARGGGRMHVKQYSRPDGNGKRRMVPYLAHYVGVEHTAGHVSLPLDVFEEAVLSQLKEIKPQEIMPPGDGKPDPVLSLSARLSDIDARIEKIQAKLLDGDEDLEPLADVLKTLRARWKETNRELEEAKRQASSPLGEAWGECSTLLDALASAADPEAARLRLRSVLRRVVESIWCLFLPGRRDRVAAVQIWFVGGSQRSYVLHYQQAKSGAFSRPARLTVRSDTEKLGPLDLRRPECVSRLEAALLKGMGY